MSRVRELTGSAPYVAIALSFLILCLIIVFVDEPMMIGDVDYRKYIALSFLGLFSLMLFFGKYIQGKHESDEKS